MHNPAALARSAIIYIVDDDDSVREGFAMLFRSAGFEPRPYATAEHFFAELEDLQNACILLDVNMPGVTGTGIQQRLLMEKCRLPVIVVSARDDDDTLADVRRLGARMFLRKPVDDQALLDAIQWVISRQAGH